MIVFRHADPRLPFLWETAGQPSGRWHEAGRGPAHYLADTPEGAWAEFLRHEEISDPADLAGVRRAMWAIEIPISRRPGRSCRKERFAAVPRRTRGANAKPSGCGRAVPSGLVAPSAALEPEGARGNQGRRRVETAARLASRR